MPHLSAAIPKEHGAGETHGQVGPAFDQPLGTAALTDMALLLTAVNTKQEKVRKEFENTS